MSLPSGAALGSTTDPQSLIRGEPSRVRADASRLGDEARRAGALAADLATVRVDGWAGGYGEPAYAAARTAERARWTAYVDLLTAAARTLTTYAEALATAQSRAADAVARWQQGEHATAQATADYNAAVDAYNAYVSRQVCVPSYGGTVVPSVGPARPGPFVDPGERLRREAEQILADARAALDEAGMLAVEELGGLPGAKVETSSGPGASAEAEGPSIDWGGWSRTFGGGEPGSLGDRPASPFAIDFGEVKAEAHAWGAEGSVEDYWGDVKVEADGTVTVAGAEVGATGRLDADGLTAEAHAAVTVIKVEGSAGAEWGYAEAEASGEASIEAEAEGDVTIGKDGVHAGGEAFAGGKVEGTIAGDVAGIGSEVTAEGWAGIGASTDLDLGLTADGKLEIGGDLGAGFGLGGKVGGHITIDPVEVAHTAGDLVVGIGELMR